ncbi:hypothetical protein H4W32_001528 [Actinophytocola algeriensis]|uniref:Uncharacterized protein n=1 Tax=Actinophytocola algeriensis TaxID=1768010 RepID=A0A7W7QD99_9PSEU|nr:hypothetical protein [Actinophytocola algeriensis]MBE1473486.1 hypothetical protein [Actinophytocola algeriensis]
MAVRLDLLEWDEHVPSLSAPGRCGRRRPPRDHRPQCPVGGAVVPRRRSRGDGRSPQRRVDVLTFARPIANPAQSTHGRRLARESRTPPQRGTVRIPTEVVTCRSTISPSGTPPARRLRARSPAATRSGRSPEQWRTSKLRILGDMPAVVHRIIVAGDPAPDRTADLIGTWTTPQAPMPAPPVPCSSSYIPSRRPNRLEMSCAFRLRPARPARLHLSRRVVIAAAVTTRREGDQITAQGDCVPLREGHTSAWVEPWPSRTRTG